MAKRSNGDPKNGFFVQVLKATKTNSLAGFACKEITAEDDSGQTTGQTAQTAAGE
jgi:hypothetical protein